MYLVVWVSKWEWDKASLSHWQQNWNRALATAQTPDAWWRTECIGFQTAPGINALFLNCRAVFIFFCTLLNILIFNCGSPLVQWIQQILPPLFNTCKGLNKICVSLQECVSVATFNRSSDYHMVAWWGLDTAGGMLWGSPSCHTSPALHPHHSKSSSIRECVCPPIAASASSALAWHFWPSPLSPTPQHSGEKQ